MEKDKEDKIKQNILSLSIKDNNQVDYYNHIEWNYFLYILSHFYCYKNYYSEISNEIKAIKQKMSFTTLIKVMNYFNSNSEVVN